MKKQLHKLLACAAILCAAYQPVFAQETDEKNEPTFCYDITFVARGDASIVDDVKVENLTQGTSLDLDGTDILRLVDVLTPVDAITVIDNGDFAINDGRVTFTPTMSGRATVQVYNTNGLLALSHSANVTAGEHQSFTLPSILAGGVYIVRVVAPGINRSVKMAGGSESINWSENQLLSDDTYTTATSRTRVEQLLTPESDKKFVEMIYAPGDVLRFTGRSGKLRTIVTNVPTLSHDITFDFYDCTDAAGYTYAIINAGGLLWMAEDLHYVGRSTVPLMLSVDEFKEYDCNKPMACFANFEQGSTSEACYYNFAGAKAALPAGWELPTTDQIKYVGEMLGGLDVAGEALKIHDTYDWQSAVEGIDSVSVGFKAFGYITADGARSFFRNRAIYMTRSTKNLMPYLFEMHDGDKELKVGDAYSCKNLRWAYHVRGCRQAPSAYNALVESFNVDMFEEGNSAPQRLLPGMVSAPAKKAKEYYNGPAGEYYTMRNEADLVMINHTNTYNPLKYTCAWPQYKDYGEAVKDPMTGKYYGEYLNTSQHERCLRKAVSQYMPDGYARPIMVYFSKEFEYGNLSSIEGDGYIHLVVHDDAKGNFAILQDVTIEGAFNNSSIANDYQPKFRRSDYSGYWMNYYMNRYMYQWMELNSQHMSVATGDLTGDRVDDILVAMGKRVVLIDGATYQKLGEFKASGNPNQVYTIADLNKDGQNDIIMVGNDVTSAGYTSIRIYFGQADQSAWERMSKNFDVASAQAEYPYGNYLDLKIGDVNGDSKNNIVVYTRKSLNNEDYVDSEAPKILVYDYLEANNQLLLKYTITEPTDEYVHHAGVELVGFRGTGYPKDIVGTRHIWQFNGDKFVQAKEVTSFWRQYKNSQDTGESTLNESFMPRATMAVGDYNLDGKEELVFMPVKCTLSKNDDYDRRVHSYAGTRTVYLNDKGEFVSNKWGGDGDICYHVIKGNGKDDGNYYKWIEGIISWPYALPLLKQPLSVLKYTGQHTQTISEPRIYALLAAAPYWADYQDKYGDAVGTFWGRTKSSADGTGRSSSNSASLIMGYEKDISLIFTKIGSIDFETTLKSEWKKSSETVTTVGYSNEYKILFDDGVVMTCTPFDTYTYECISTPDPDGVGALVNISIPRTPRTMCVSLKDYTRLRADNKEIPDLRRLFSHTPGNPFSYPTDASAYPKEALWGNGSAVDGLQGTGSSSSTTMGISMDKETTQSNSFSFDLDVQLVINAFGCKLGAGYGHGEEWSTSHTEGEGFNVGAEVLSPERLGDAEGFRWNICWYKQKYCGQEFSVVNFIVRH